MRYNCTTLAHVWQYMVQWRKLPLKHAKAIHRIWSRVIWAFLSTQKVDLLPSKRFPLCPYTARPWRKSPGPVWCTTNPGPVLIGTVSQRNSIRDSQHFLLLSLFRMFPWSWFASISGLLHSVQAIVTHCCWTWFWYVRGLIENTIGPDITQILQVRNFNIERTFLREITDLGMEKIPASPTFSMAVIAAGRAFPVAKTIVTPNSIAAFRASTEEGNTWLLLSKRVPSMSNASSLISLFQRLLLFACLSVYQ